MPKFNEYTEKTNPDDVDIFLLQDAASTKKISFLNIFNRIKTKLGLGDLATKSKVAQSDLEDALANLIAGKLTSSGIANNLTTTDTTKVLAAPQGKALLESITSALTLIGSLDALTTAEKTNLVGAINELVTSLTTLNSKLQEANAKYAYNIKNYNANILTFAESLADGTFCMMQYDGYSASGAINAAPSNSSGVALISKTSANFIVILAIPYTGGKFTRTKNNGTWRAWE